MANVSLRLNSAELRLENFVFFCERGDEGGRLAGKYLIEHDPKMIPDLDAYLNETQRLRDELSAIEGLMVMDTVTNFMLVNMDFGDVKELKKWLIDSYGILIRDASNFRGLDNHCFRVTARTREEDDMLVEAIRKYKAWRDENQ